MRIEEFSDSLLFSLVLIGCRKLVVLDMTGCISGICIAKEDFREDVGKTLIKLRLHEEETLDRMDGRAVLSSSVMGCIAKHCPNLRSLGLDLESNG